MSLENLARVLDTRIPVGIQKCCLQEVWAPMPTFSVESKTLRGNALL